MIKFIYLYIFNVDSRINFGRPKPYLRRWKCLTLLRIFRLIFFNTRSSCLDKGRNFGRVRFSLPRRICSSRVRTSSFFSSPHKLLDEEVERTDFGELCTLAQSDEEQSSEEPLPLVEDASSGTWRNSLKIPNAARSTSKGSGEKSELLKNQKTTNFTFKESQVGGQPQIQRFDTDEGSEGLLLRNKWLIVPKCLRQLEPAKATIKTSTKSTDPVIM